MEFHEVVSSNIAALRWDEGSGTPDVGTLRVRFKGGAEWEYDDVPRQVFLAVARASSVGSTFHRLVKGAKFKARKVKEDLMEKVSKPVTAPKSTAQPKKTPAVTKGVGR